ncbi:flavin reductase family protein [Natrarchaeobius oligotrophus]|uniref:Flavin reductase family protein n=1 Tax=Natrarchaeobius chitinivorans TaxID=1679083 RepID=A0A3N6MM30_NATCH|nr:flavin reductase family protein [Natrarchaeobius chitinivorans]RQH02585.1 flavin reductase family protein [Natrarchaeobius chitinivorans]
MALELDPEEYKDSMSRILMSIVTPRPIGWISTEWNGRDNLAPFSYFNAVSSYPPVVMFSGRRRNGRRKDSVRFAMESGEFVANLVTEDLVEEMDATSAPLDGVSEFDVVGLDREPSETVTPPRVADAAAKLECTVIDTLEVYDNVLVFGEVQHISADERLTTDGKVDMNRVDSVGRLGGPHYTGLRFLDVEQSKFGPWKESAPTGFRVDETSLTLKVDDDEFEAVQNALSRIDDGESITSVAADTQFSESELAECTDRRPIYLDLEADDMRIEAALAEAGYLY